MLQAIAIDDEPIALEIIETHSSKVNFIDLQKTFTSSATALAYLAKHPVDLIFLDIKMPDMSGIELTRYFKGNPMIIFTTAYSDHAVKGFELEAVDYLLKPFSLERFIRACIRCHELWRMKANTKNDGQALFLRDGYDMVRVYLDDILFLKSAGNYIKFQTGKREVMARMTFKEAKDQLTDEFCQVHRSYIIHSTKVSRIEKKKVIIDQYAIPIGSNFSTGLSEHFGLAVQND